MTGCRIAGNGYRDYYPCSIFTRSAVADVHCRVHVSAYLLRALSVPSSLRTPYVAPLHRAPARTSADQCRHIPAHFGYVDLIAISLTRAANSAGSVNRCPRCCRKINVTVCPSGIVDAHFFFVRLRERWTLPA